jgi:hypothetical protein
MRAEELKIDPFGLLVGHTWCEVGLILDAINSHRITRFVEIGVHKGGLCAMLAHTTEHLPYFKYLGVEIDEEIIDPTVKKLFHPVVTSQGIRQLWIMDAHAPQTIHDVAHWIRQDQGPALIYCDGGNKVKEFNLYVSQIREQDFIAAHDFDYGGYDRAEIRPEDVADGVAKHGLLGVGFAAPYRIALWRKVSK